MRTITRTNRNRIVAAIVGLDDRSADIDVYGPKVVAIFTGSDPMDFRDVDNEIGNAHPAYAGKGWMVRRVRNHPVWGKHLRAALGSTTSTIR